MRPYFIFLLLRRIRGIWYLIKDPKVPIYQKALVIFGLAYLISPIDLIPAPVLGFSIIDDLALWTFILSYLKDQLDKYYPQNQKEKQASFKGKKIIESVEYEVEEDDEEVRKDW